MAEEQLYKALKTRIYPNPKQRRFIHQNFIVNKYIWNYFLDYLQNNYQECKKYLDENKENMSDDELKEIKKKMYPSKFDLINKLSELKKKETWLKNSESTSLQNTIGNLYQGYQNMFRGDARLPRFKRNLHSYTSNITSPLKTNSIDREKHLLKIPRLGKVFYPYSEKLKMNSIQTITVSEDNLHNFYVSIMYKNGFSTSNLDNLNASKMIGIDLGLTNFATLSNGDTIPAMQFDYTSRKDIIRKRKLARRGKAAFKKVKAFNHKHAKDDTPLMKVDDLKGYRDIKKADAKVEKKKALRRKNFLQNIANSLVKQYDFIVIEDLKINKMLKNKFLSRRIANASWRSFRTMLENKCKEKGKILMVVSAYNTTRICSQCGYYNGIKNLSVDKWTCPHCKSHLIRQVNSAKNILNKGIEEWKVKKDK
ncbi:hypothetical protein DY052_06135 [Apilactobacillus timberlakei]|uniref:RNA-guided endonuclease InsQ/TnpB family protein n=1 Tax=Apilactobacillus timberlakei TaxID=2008380 RepID=UPI00112BCF27|nr:RNA-guided endonuclease TnpB family protein [Apilactobacillus timberlakei]TPR15003.1 hypothetical protein DY052_06135 [Apilactobacillus timberlakei]